MRFAVSIPQFVADGAFDPAAFRDYLTRAEALGFDGAWTLDQVIGPSPVLDALTTMAYAAACTKRMRLGCAVFVSTHHNPVLLAKSLGSLDQMSRGRLDVGVGSGAGGRNFSAFGVDPATIVSRFVDGVRVMKALWTEPAVTDDGAFWQLTGVTMEPKPFQEPHPPLWFGGGHPAALRRAVRYGDGFIGGGSSTTARFAEQVQIVRVELAAQGRDAASFPIAKRVYIEIDDDGARARERIAGAIDRFYGRPGMAPVTVAGTAEECVRGLRAVAEAGAELIVLTMFHNEAKQMERLAAGVLPRLDWQQAIP